MKQFRDTPYYVTEDGRVFRNGRQLKFGIGKRGYCNIGLSIFNVLYYFLVHRLVAELYIPNPDNKPEVNHKNGIKSDNRVSNLEWNTRKENQQHSAKVLKNKVGINNYQSKFTEEEIQYIRSNYIPRHKEFSQNALSRKFNVNQKTIWCIIHNKTWVNLFS
jgi:hypothetical protein